MRNDEWLMEKFPNQAKWWINRWINSPTRKSRNMKSPNNEFRRLNYVLYWDILTRHSIELGIFSTRFTHDETTFLVKMSFSPWSKKNWSEERKIVDNPWKAVIINPKTIKWMWNFEFIVSHLANLPKLLSLVAAII